MSSPAVEHHHSEDQGHVVSLGLLAGVWLALLVLTVVTVGAIYVNLGKLNLWLAMIIATIKALLVAVYFMHLRWDRPFNAYILVGSLIFVLLFIGFVMMDTAAYLPEIDFKDTLHP
ncbi:MAG: hypothetical protein HJJLKODD_01886 [Phycisphaerae bacterium]|nr:hypothetical protein [Phycisphaerae bacterium]